MKTFFKLFKFQIDEIYDLFKGRNIKKMLWSAAKYLFLLGVTTLVAYLLLMQVFVLNFAINKQLISIVLLATQCIAFLFATGSIISVLFLNKNNELLLTLPASPNQVYMSKLLVVYIREIVVNTAYTFPLLLTLGIMGKFSAWFFVSLPFVMFLLPVLPLALAAFISIPAMKILKFLKQHVIVASVLLLALVSVLLYFYIAFLSVFATSFNITSKLVETIISVNTSVLNFGNKNWLFLRLAESIMDIKLTYWLFVYLGVGLTCLVGAILLIRPFYFKTAMESNENVTAKISKKEKQFKKRTPFWSLVVKEVHTVFRTPGGIFQYFAFTMLMPVIVLLYDRLLLTMVVNQTGHMMIAGSHVLVAAVLAMLSNLVSASAISKEGANFIHIKTMPVDYYTQTLAKVVFNAVLTIGAVLITSVVTFFYLEAKVVIFTTLSVIFAAVAHICLSYDLDLKSPTLDWYDNSEITQINKNTTVSMIWGMFISLVMAAVIFTMTNLAESVIPWLILLLASAAFCVYRVYILILRVSYQYGKVEI